MQLVVLGAGTVGWLAEYDAVGALEDLCHEARGAETLGHKTCVIFNIYILARPNEATSGLNRKSYHRHAFFILVDQVKLHELLYVIPFVDLLKDLCELFVIFLITLATRAQVQRQPPVNRTLETVMCKLSDILIGICHCHEDAGSLHIIDNHLARRDGLRFIFLVGGAQRLNFARMFQLDVDATVLATDALPDDDDRLLPALDVFALVFYYDWLFEDGAVA